MKILFSATHFWKVNYFIFSQSGAEVVITVFGNFHQFLSRKKTAISLRIKVRIYFCKKSKYPLSSNRQFLVKFYVENISKIITLVPEGRWYKDTFVRFHFLIPVRKLKAKYSTSFVTWRLVEKVVETTSGTKDRGFESPRQRGKENIKTLQTCEGRRFKSRGHLKVVF
jgi:hypothetical protein